MRTGFFLSLLVLCVLGCDTPKPEGIPSLVPVTVKVIQDGKPLADAMVSLMPTDVENARWTSGGKTNAKGIANPVVYGQYPGAAVGRYKICVSKTETPPSPAPTSRDETPPPQKTYNLVDPKFGDVQTTEEVEITQSSGNLTIDVGAAVRIEIPPR